MWNNKKKAITFSYDDGVTQDIRLIEILNRYGLKGTFNLNSGKLGQTGSVSVDGLPVLHNKVPAEKVKEIYAGHEVAVHTVNHPCLTCLSEEDIVREVEEDRKTLSELCGYPVTGMAYPCGGINNDERVWDVLRRRTPIRFSRTITSSHSFDLQEDLIHFNPTVYHIEPELTDIVRRFLESSSDAPQLLYIWGHAYELDTHWIPWEKFEEVCRMLAHHDDIFYGTNSEVFFS